MASSESGKTAVYIQSSEDVDDALGKHILKVLSLKTQETLPEFSSERLISSCCFVLPLPTSVAQAVCAIERDSILLNNGGKGKRLVKISVSVNPPNPSHSGTDVRHGASSHSGTEVVDKSMPKSKSSDESLSEFEVISSPIDNSESDPLDAKAPAAVASPKSPTETGCTIWVGSIPPYTEPEELKRFIEDCCGPLQALPVIRESRGRGLYSFVEFERSVDAEKFVSGGPFIFGNSGLIRKYKIPSPNRPSIGVWSEWDRRSQSEEGSPKFQLVSDAATASSLKNSPQKKRLDFATGQVAKETPQAPPNKFQLENAEIPETIWVGNVPPYTEPEELGLFIEREFGPLVKLPVIKESRGGDPSHMHYAFVEFQRKTDAEKFLSRGEPVIFRNCSLKRRHKLRNWKSLDAKSEDGRSETTETFLERVWLDYYPRETQGTEKKQKGERNQVAVNDKESFVEVKGTETLPLERTKSLAISETDGGTKSAATEAKSPLGTPERKESFGVQIRGVNGISSREVLRQYLQSEKHSGGDRIVKIKVETAWDWACMWYDSLETMKRVADWCGRRKDELPGVHRLEEKELHASCLPPVCPSAAYLKNVPDWVESDRLKDYLVARAKEDLDNLSFREDNTGAIIKFASEIDIDRLKCQLKECPLKSGEKQIQLDPCRIYYPNAIQIYEASEFHRDAIELAVEAELKRMGDGLVCPDVKHVQIFKDQRLVLVTFVDYQAVDCIDSSLNINRKKLTWRPYYDCLGLESKINRANFERENKTSAVRIPVSDTQAEVLKTEEARVIIDGMLKNEAALKCTWEVAENDSVADTRLEKDRGWILRVVARQQTQGKIIGKRILDCLKTEKLQLDAEKLKVVTTGFEDARTNLEAKFGGVKIRTDASGSVEVCGVEPGFSQVCTALEDHLCTNAEYTRELLRGKGIVHFVERFCQEQMIDIRVKFGSANLKMDKEEGVITGKGRLSDLTEVRKKLLSMTEEIQREEYMVRKPGMSDFFRSSDGEERLKKIGEGLQVVIGDQEKFLDSASPGDAALSGARSERVMSGKLDRGSNCPALKVGVYKGDLTLQDTDCIVNAANPDLIHGGGLAGVIVRNGGPGIQQECRDFISRLGRPLKPGDVYISQSGRLPCKRIVHAVGPRWRGGKHNERMFLQNAVTNSLSETAKEELKSIAIPAISTGIFDYPAENAVPTIVEKALDVSKAAGKELVEIRFVENSSDAVVGLFCASLKKYPGFREDSKETVAELPSIRPALANQRRGSSTERAPPMAAASGDATSRGMTDRNPNGIDVCLVPDDIANFAGIGGSDVIVNTTGTSIVGGGKSSRALLAAAGSGVDGEIQQKYPNGIGCGDVAITGAGVLPVKFLYHVALPNFDGGDGTCISRIVKKCLNEANKMQIRSVAFPAIGTGGLGYPAKLAVRRIMDGVGQVQKGSVESVFLVVFPGDKVTTDAFSRALPLREDAPKTSDSWRNRPVLSEEEYGTSTDTAEAEDIFFDAVDKIEASNAVTIEKLRVEVVQRNICEEPTDSILCPSNEQLDLSMGGVAMALVEKGGAEFQLKILGTHRRAMKNKKIVSVVTGPCLSARSVIFVDAPSVPDKWEEVLLKVLELAENQGDKTVSMPAVGTGAHNLNASSIAEVMLHAFRSYVGNRKDKLRLERIRIVIHPSQAKFFETFCDSVSNMVDGPSAQHPTKKQGIWANLMDKLFAKSEDEEQATEVKRVAREEELILSIFGTASQIRKAHNELEKQCNDLCPSRVIPNDVIKKLQMHQIREMKSRMFAEYRVQLFVSAQQGKMTITGVKGKVDEAYAELKVLLGEFEHKLKLLEIPLSATWFERKADSSWVPLGRQLIAVLEAGWREKGGKYDFQVEGATVTSHKNGMGQMRVEGKTLIVKRKEHSDRLPVEWVSPADSHQMRMEVLDARSSEYKTVAQMVQRTSAVTITQIERVENVSLYQKWVAELERVEKQMPHGNPAQKLLFHGTTKPGNIPVICEGGFNRSLAGINGTMYGNGSYFARDFSYSQRYAGGSGKMIVAKVITGHYTQGAGGMVTAPLDQNTQKPYNSVVDNQANPTIFVVFRDWEAYPAYVVTFQ